MHLFSSRFTIDIYNMEREQLLTDIKNAHYISVMIDGATDSGILENEIVYVKFFSKERGVVQSFLGIEDVKHAHTAGVLSVVQSGTPIFSTVITLSCSWPMNNCFFFLMCLRKQAWKSGRRSWSSFVLMV